MTLVLLFTRSKDDGWAWWSLGKRAVGSMVRPRDGAEFVCWHNFEGLAVPGILFPLGGLVNHLKIHIKEGEVS